MKKRETIPAERTRTIIQELVGLLDGNSLPVSELSREVGKSEKEIYDYLAALQKSHNLVITPARCAACGFEFTKRSKVKKPSKCPRCRGTHIVAPLYSVTSR